MFYPKIDLKRRGWILLGVAGILVFVLGFIGLKQTSERAGEHLGYFDLGSAAVELFHGGARFPLTNPRYSPEAPALQIARLAAKLLLALAAVKAFSLLVLERIAVYRFRKSREHVLILGVGRKGRSFLTNLPKKTKGNARAPAAIEKNALAEGLQEAKRSGALVLTGTVTDSVHLEKARAIHAGVVIAVTGDDEVNIRAIMKIAQLRANLYRKGDRKLTRARLFAHVASWETRQMFARQPPFSMIDRATGTEALMFNIHATAARDLIRDFAIGVRANERGSAAVRILLVANGDFMDEFLRAAIVFCQFGNGRLPQITVLTPDNKAAASFFLRHQSVPLVAEVEFIVMEARDIPHADFESLCKGQPFQLAVFALGDDLRTLYAARNAVGFDHGFQGKIVACLEQENKSLDDLLKGASGVQVLAAIDMAASFCRLELLETPALEAEARALHETYCKELIARGDTVATNPSLVSWDDLPEYLRDSNRCAALHNEIKRAAVAQCHGESINNLLERLARAEHRRWMAERIMNGWRYGESKDDFRRLHPMIVPYDNLTDEQKEKDHQIVREVLALK